MWHSLFRYSKYIDKRSKQDIYSHRAYSPVGTYNFPHGEREVNSFKFCKEFEGHKYFSDLGI